MKKIIFFIVGIILSISTVAQQSQQSGVAVNLDVYGGGSQKPTLRCYADKLYYYALEREYSEGDRYKININAPSGKYLYILCTDEHHHAVVLYEGVTMKEQSIPERGFVELDNTKGHDYLCLFFSTDRLNIESIIQAYNNASGAELTRIYSAISKWVTSQENIRYVHNRIEFICNTQSKMVPVIIEMIHK